MARNRMLNPDFWLDEEVAKLSPHARLLFLGLWGICDDNHATLPDRPEWIKVQVFPYEEVNIRDCLIELEKIGKIVRFMFGENHYWFIKNFFKYQTINRPSKPKYPPYQIKTGVLMEPSVSTHSEVKEVKLKEKKELGASTKQTEQQIQKIREDLARGKKMTL